MIFDIFSSVVNPSRSCYSFHRDPCGAECIPAPTTPLKPYDESVRSMRNHHCYKPPWMFRNGHLQTLYPGLFRSVKGVVFERRRITTPDGDFLDLDWSRVGSRRLAVISHGLEGHSRRPYMLGMARALNDDHIDVLAWNYRGCGGEPNRLVRMYHNGVTDDLHRVVAYGLETGGYHTVYLIGFSLGGNLTLLYLGRQAEPVPQQVRAAITFSVPCDLTDASRQMEKRANAIYMRQFLISLHQKIKAKQHRYPGILDDAGFSRIKTFQQFDDRYTAPLHGFRDAQDYWTRCSSRPWLAGIEVPALIVNALDDPFLTGGCYPLQECALNPRVTLETPRHGGHVGFVDFRADGRYWSEQRALAFIRQLGGAR